MLETKTVTNGPIPNQLQRACHDTLPWLISVSLDATRFHSHRTGRAGRIASRRAPVGKRRPDGSALRSYKGDFIEW